MRPGTAAHGPAISVAGPLGRAALAYAARGWRVFPLRLDDKRPAVAEWERKATTDPVRIARAWSGPYARSGIGIACGPSALVVIDLDTRKHEGDAPPPAWDLPGVVDGGDVLAHLFHHHGDTLPIGLTPTARTGSGGLHLYFAAPEAAVRNSAGRLGWKVDVRAVGGYVVAPPSTVAGRPYRWDTGPDTALRPLPPWLLGLLQSTASTGPERPRSLNTVPPSRFMAGLLRIVLAAGHGERNSRLFWASCKAFEHAAAGRIDPRTAAACLLDAATAVGLDEREARHTITSAHRATTGQGHA